MDASGAANLAVLWDYHQVRVAVNSSINNWNFRLQRLLFPRRKLFFLSDDRFVFTGSSGEFLCGLQYVDFGLKQWTFCVTDLVSSEDERRAGALVAADLRDYALRQGAKECLVLFSPSGWPKDTFLLQKDGIIWDAFPKS